MRSSASYASESHQGISEVTLQPGGTAHFDLRYLPGAPGDGSKLISVDKMVITPPNGYTQAEMTWDQDVILQDEATHPGTYIMPVVSGSSPRCGDRCGSTAPLMTTRHTSRTTLRLSYDPLHRLTSGVPVTPRSQAAA